MKKYNLFKVLAITVIVTWILTLFIPSSYLDYSGKVVTDSVSGLGIVGLLSNLSISISYFNGIAVFLIAVACFYAIISKLDVYNKFVDNTATTFKNKEGLLVTITIIVFGVLACLVKDAMILIMFMPFIYQVMKKLEIDKKVILSSTIIATFVGAMNGIYDNTLFTTFNLKVNTLLLVKLIVLVLSLAILIFFTAPKKVKDSNSKKTAKKTSDKKAVKASTKSTTVKTVKKQNSKERKVNKVVYAILTLLLGTIGINKFYAGKIKAGILNIIFCWTLVPTILSIVEFITVLTEKADKDGKIPVNSNRRENVLFATSLVLFVLFAIATIIPWESLFAKFTAFSDFNTWLSNLKVGKYQIFNNVIGAPMATDSATGSTTGVISAIGSWAMTDMAIFLFIITAVIAICKKIKLDEFISSATSGIKKVLPVAITAMLISIVLVISVTTGINTTICNWIATLSKGFNIATATLSTMVGSVLTADFYYFVSSVASIFTGIASDTNLYGVVALIAQSIYYLMMIIAPTSVGLIIGLYYLDIPYGKWFKYIWKVLLSLFVLIMISVIIVFVLV